MHRSIKRRLHKRRWRNREKGYLKGFINFIAHELTPRQRRKRNKLMWMDD